MKIYTHSGAFHCDDAMACAIARLAGFGPGIIRVREIPDVLDFSDIVIDVGGVYDPSINRFDHHQRGGAADGMAATGKVWQKFGTQLCDGDQEVADRVYLTLLASIDRADIGISDWTPVSTEWRHLSASGFISSMNPPFGCSKEESDKAFGAAVNACTFALKGAIEQARTYVKMQHVVAAAERPIPEVLVLSQGGPWQEHVLINKKLSEVLYVIYPSDRGGYNIQCVPASLGSFETRKLLPAAWAGLRGEELAKAVDLNLQIGPELFCHPGRFIAGACNLEDVLKLAKLAVAS